MPRIPFTSSRSKARSVVVRTFPWEPWRARKRSRSRRRAPPRRRRHRRGRASSRRPSSSRQGSPPSGRRRRRRERLLDVTDALLRPVQQDDVGGHPTPFLAGTDRSTPCWNGTRPELPGRLRPRPPWQAALELRSSCAYSIALRGSSHLRRNSSSIKQLQRSLGRPPRRTTRSETDRRSPRAHGQGALILHRAGRRERAQPAGGGATVLADEAPDAFAEAGHARLHAEPFLRLGVARGIGTRRRCQSVANLDVAPNAGSTPTGRRAASQGVHRGQTPLSPHAAAPSRRTERTIVASGPPSDFSLL